MLVTCMFMHLLDVFQLNYEESLDWLKNRPSEFRDYVQESLCRQVRAINYLSDQGMFFWDYGNAFLLEAGRAGAHVYRDETKSTFLYPSYVQDIMG